jgi:O-antigen/teichoic acid export membrane protein
MLKHLRQLASESLIYGLSGMMARSISIFLVPINTRIFSPEDYGVMSLVSSTMVVFSAFVMLALDTSAHRWYWETENIDDRKNTLASWAWCQITISLPFALLIFVLSEKLGEVIVGREDAGLYFRLAALTLPLSALGWVTLHWLRMQRRPWATTGYALGASLLEILLWILLVVFLHQGLAGVYIVQILMAAVGTVAGIWLMRDWVNPCHFRWSRLREMLRYGLPLIPAPLLLWVMNYSDRFFLQYYASTHEVGLYQVGISIASLVALGTGAFQRAWGPFALSIHKQENARSVYANAFLAYVCLNSLTSAVLALFAPEAILLVATEQYLGAIPVVGILAFSYVMNGLGNIAAIGPTIVKTTRPTGLAITAAAGVNIGLNLLLVPHFGKVGSALAALLSQSVVPIYLFYYSQQLYPIPYRFGAALGILGFSFALVFFAGGWQPKSLWVGITAKVALLAMFIPAVFLLRIVTIGQVKRMLNSRLSLRVVT